MFNNCSLLEALDKGVLLKTLLEDCKTDPLLVEIGGSVVLDIPIPAAVLKVL